METPFSLIIKNLRYYGQKAIVRLREIRCAVSTPVLRQPIFIVGCSRAGTTLVYKTFSESRQLGSLGKETHDFWAGLHPLSDRGWNSHEIPADCATDSDRRYVSRYFYSRTGKLRVVDKNNQNGLSIPYLHNLFPDAHFVFIKRSPGDNINSLIHGWGKGDEFGVWSDQLPDNVAVSGGAYKRWCFFLSDNWREYRDRSIEEVCAFQYRSMNDAILASKRVVPDTQWHEIVYEDLISEPVNGFRQLFEACGLQFDNHLEEHCRTVIAKPYNAFSEIRVNKWKDGKFRDQIERVLPMVAETSRNLGFPPIT
jgi:hypothetical protein